MKMYIRSNSGSASSNEVVNIINDINQSDIDSRSKVYKIQSILGKIDDNYELGLSRNNGKSIGLRVYKSGFKWIDSDGGYYTYSSSDIADEIVNGRYTFVVTLFDRDTLKPESNMSKQYAPKMWR